MRQTDTQMQARNTKRRTPRRASVTADPDEPQTHKRGRKHQGKRQNPCSASSPKRSRLRSAKAQTASSETAHAQPGGDRRECDTIVYGPTHTNETTTQCLHNTIGYMWTRQMRNVFEARGLTEQSVSKRAKPPASGQRKREDEPAEVAPVQIQIKRNKT